MDIINLPQDRFEGIQKGVQFYDYIAKASAFQGKCVLNTNAISLVISGSKRMMFADKTVNINSDEFHMLSAGNCLASIELSKDQEFRSILVFFDNRVLTDFYLKYKDLCDHKPKPHQSYLAFKKDAFIQHYIDSLHLLMQSGRILEEMSQLKFEELMVYLIKKSPAEILSFQIKTRSDFDDFQIRKTVETNIDSDLTLDDLAFLCNMSLSTFNRRFAKIYNMTPRQYILERRMTLAKQLLEQNREKPSEVYHKVGYESHSSFSQAFKQTFGVTPSEYANKN